MRHTMVIGTTEPQDFRAKNNGEVFVGTGWDLGIDWRETPNLTAEQLAALADITVEWLDAAAGTVRATGDGLGDLPLGRYHFRLTVTDADGKVGFIPTGAAAAEWYVVQV